MDFNQRLEKAILRGKQRGESRAASEQAKQLSEEDYKRLHTQHRLELSDYIEKCIQSLPTHFPGFQSETIYGERGWGAACYRDDLKIEAGRRDTSYSRLEMTIRPFTPAHILELACKGAINNKEVFNRTFYQKIDEADAHHFIELIDVWILEYAEMYAAKN